MCPGIQASAGVEGRLPRTDEEDHTVRSARTAGAAVLGTAALALLSVPTRGATLAEARIFIELNDSAQDVGVHMFFDGQWQSMRVLDPAGRVIFDVAGHNALGDIGLSELFVEGEEPSLEELPLAELFARFPEGLYTFDGRGEDGERIRTKARFSHRIPGAPDVVSPQEGIPQDRLNTVIDWDPVTTPAGVQIAGYEVIVEGDGVKSSIKVPAWLTRLKVPPEILRAGRAYKFEVISIEANHNQTIFEGEFETAE
jgi:hypothetical protein